MKLAQRMSRLGTESAFEVLARARALEAQGREIVHLEIGEPDFDTPPHIIEAACKALQRRADPLYPLGGHPCSCARPSPRRSSETRGHAGRPSAGGGDAGRQADHVLHHPGAGRAGRRGDLSQPRLSDL